MFKRYSDSSTTTAFYYSFDNIFNTFGMYGFYANERIKIPYNMDFIVKYFGSDLLSVPSYLTYNESNELVGLKNGNKFIRFFPKKRVYYNDKFINKLLEDNF